MIWVALSATVGCYQGAHTDAPARAVELYRASLPPEPKPLGASRLTLTEAVRRAKATSGKLAAVRAKAAKTQAHVGDAARVHNPELRVSGVRVDQIARREPEAKVRLRFRPPRPVENEARTAEAEAEARGADTAIAAEEHRIEARVIDLFARIHALEAELTLRERVAALERELAGRLAARVAESHGTALDQALAQLKAEDASSDAAETRGERLRLLGDLGDEIGATLDEGTKLDGGPDATLEPVALPGEQELVEQALRNAPGIGAAAARMDAASAKGDAERAQQWPWFTFLDIGYVFEPVAEGSPQGRNWLFGAGLELPVFDWNQGGVDTADAARVEAERELDAEVGHVVAEVRSKRREVQTAAEAVRSFRAGPRQAAARASEEAERALQAGHVDDLVALGVEGRRAAVELEGRKLVRRYLVALGELEAVTGWHPGAP
jgi:outer membrane protein, heavy metal efflux system